MITHIFKNCEFGPFVGKLFCSAIFLQLSDNLQNTLDLLLCDSMTDDGGQQLSIITKSACKSWTARATIKQYFRLVFLHVWSLHRASQSVSNVLIFLSVVLLYEQGEQKRKMHLSCTSTFIFVFGVCAVPLFYLTMQLKLHLEPL